jgi:ketosteroid isomerase-like protein
VTTATTDSRSRIVELISSYARAMDTNDWPGVRATLADEVDVDYQQATGWPPDPRLPADQLAEDLRGLLDRPGLTVQTLTTNHLVDLADDRASCVSDYYVVHHDQDGRDFEVRGRYHLGFADSAAGWRITRVHVGVSWTKGDLGVLTG